MIIDPNYTMLKKVGNIYLSNEEREILDKFGINYFSCKSLSELIFIIESLNIEDDIMQNVLDRLDERNYYENFDK